jgi:enoyl-CoA hydratase
MPYQSILPATSGRVRTLQLHRPDARNALNSLLMDELISALREAEADSTIGAVIITGNEKVFAAGADIKQMANASVVDMMNSAFIGYWDALRLISKPLIAAVSGWCLGGGCELAMACDLIVASDSAIFGQPEIRPAAHRSGSAPVRVGQPPLSHRRIFGEERGVGGQNRRQVPRRAACGERGSQPLF